MNNLLSWMDGNKLLVGMAVSFLFTVITGVIARVTVAECCYDSADIVWIFITVSGFFAFFGTFGCYIKKFRSGQETQNQAIEFNTSAIELTPANVNNIVDSTQNKLTEEDLDKEISLFEKRKKLAQLKNEVINLETAGIRASTSSSLGQVVVARRDY